MTSAARPLDRAVPRRHHRERHRRHIAAPAAAVRAAVEACTIRATDVRSRRAFAADRVVIRPFSGAIRRSRLRAVEQRVLAPAA